MELLKLPLGFRFCPKPYELIKYLTCKVTSEPLPCDGIIHHELNPYDEKQIPDIFSAVEKRDEVYMFTKLTKKGRAGNTNVNRRVGKGTWHGGPKSSPVSDKEGTQVGVLRKLTYREKNSHYNNKFMMTEYTLVEGTSLQYSSLNDYVLCRISKNGRSRNTNNISSSDSDPMDLVPSSPSIDTLEDILQLAVVPTIGSQHIPDYGLPAHPAPQHELDVLPLAVAVPSAPSIDTHEDVLQLAVVPTIESQLIPDYGLPEFQSFYILPAPQDGLDEVLKLTPFDKSWEGCSDLFDD